MNYINIGKKEGATLHLGGERHGTEGYFIQPTIFTDVTPGMTIVKEEIFGPGTSPSIHHAFLITSNVSNPKLQLWWWPSSTTKMT
jgi:hypothetical protein